MGIGTVGPEEDEDGPGGDDDDGGEDGAGGGGFGPGEDVSRVSLEGGGTVCDSDIGSVLCFIFCKIVRHAIESGQSKAMGYYMLWALQKGKRISSHLRRSQSSKVHVFVLDVSLQTK